MGQALSEHKIFFVVWHRIMKTEQCLSILLLSLVYILTTVLTFLKITLWNVWYFWVG